MTHIYTNQVVYNRWSAEGIQSFTEKSLQPCGFCHRTVTAYTDHAIHQRGCILRPYLTSKTCKRVPVKIQR